MRHFLLAGLGIGLVCLHAAPVGAERAERKPVQTRQTAQNGNTNGSTGGNNSGARSHPDCPGRIGPGGCEGDQEGTQTGLFGTGSTGITASVKAGGIFQSGSRNHAGSVNSTGRGFSEVVRGSNLKGFYTEFNISADINSFNGGFVDGGYLSFTGAYSWAGGKASGVSGLNDLSYIPYVDSNPAVRAGATGQSANIETSFDEYMAQLDLFLFSFAFPLSTSFGNGAFLPRQRGDSAHGTRSLEFSDPLDGSHRSFLFRRGSALKFIFGAGLAGGMTRVRDDVKFSSLQIPGANSRIIARATAFSALARFHLGAKYYTDLGSGKLFAHALATFGVGVTTVRGRAQQSIPILGANPRQDDSVSRGAYQVDLNATVGYQMGNVILGVSALYRFRANEAFMRLPVVDGRAHVAFRNSHAVALMGFVKVKLY